MLKLFPIVLLITVILFAGLLAVFGSMMQSQSESEDRQKFRVGIVGDTDGSYLGFGFSALQTLDSTRFALEFEMLDEPAAADALMRRDIAAYLVFPEGFVEAALRGEVRTIRFVTTEGAGGLVPIFKEEIAKAATELLLESEKGVYGVQGALDGNGYRQLSYQYLNEMNVEYVSFVFRRSEIYQVSELGISDGLTTPQYFFCSITVLLLMLLGLPYAVVFVKKDWAFSRMLASRRFPAVGQVACEYAAYAGVMLLLVAVIAAGFSLAAGRVPALSELIDPEYLTSLGLAILPAVLMIAALNSMIFELSGNIVNGILLQFFATVSLCYVTGCFYPIYTFPQAVQLVAPYLPTGLMRGYLADCLIGQGSLLRLGGLLAFTAVFFAVTVAVRRHHITVKEG